MNPDQLRAQQRETPAGKLLAEIGRDYYDTESSARRVAEHAAEMIEKLKSEIERQARMLREATDERDTSVALAEGRHAIECIKKLHAAIGYCCVEDGGPKETIDDRIVDAAVSSIRSLRRFQEIARATDRALVCITNGTPPDIDAIKDGCIKIHMRQMLEKAAAVKTALAAANEDCFKTLTERDAARADIQLLVGVLKEHCSNAVPGLQERIDAAIAKVLS